MAMLRKPLSLFQLKKQPWTAVNFRGLPTHLDTCTLQLYSLLNSPQMIYHIYQESVQLICRLHRSIEWNWGSMILRNNGSKLTQSGQANTKWYVSWVSEIFNIVYCRILMSVTARMVKMKVLLHSWLRSYKRSNNKFVRFILNYWKSACFQSQHSQRSSTQSSCLV